MHLARVAMAGKSQWSRLLLLQQPPALPLRTLILGAATKVPPAIPHRQWTPAHGDGEWRVHRNPAHKCIDAIARLGPAPREFLRHNVDKREDTSREAIRFKAETEGTCQLNRTKFANKVPMTA
jgi:hypothetical protein